MANPIKKDELVTEEALNQLNAMATTLTTIAENLTKAKAACQGWGEEEKKNVATTGDNVEELTKMSARISQLEDTIKKLTAAEKENNEQLKRTNEEARKYKKLTDDEKESVKKLSSDLEYYVKLMHSSNEANQKLGQLYAKNIAEIDIQKKSYNELYQTYNALKDALNQMTVAERQNTAAGQAMTNQAKEIRDTLNNLQQATGNYALNVGNYMSAMNGLQMQTQQILREIPSAQNLSQFFLAISNNIPMFTDALARYNKGLPEIKANLAAVTAEIAKQNAQLATMNVETTEYAAKQEYVNALKKQEVALQGATVSGWRAVLKSVVSWQTLLIAGLLLLRKIPDLLKDIGHWFTHISQEVKMLIAVNNEAANTVGSMRAKYKALQKEWQNLKKEDMPAWLKQNENEWAELGYKIDDANKAEDFYVRNTEKVQKAIDDRARSIAAMKIAAEKYEEAFRKQIEAETAVETGTVSSWSRIKQIGQIFHATLLLGPGAYNTIVKEGAKQALKDAESYKKELEDEAEKLMTEADNIIDRFVLPGPIKTGDDDGNGNGKKEKEPTEQNTTDKYWEAEQALLEAQQEGYDLERSLAKMNRDKQRDELINWYVDQRLALDENLKNGFISQQKYDASIQELDRQNAALREGINRKYWDNINKINREEAEKALKARENRTIREINAITAVELKASSKRVRNTAQEAAKNNVLVENLNRLLNARKELIALDIASDETRSFEERTKALEKLNKEISKYASQLDFSKKLSGYSSISDMITKNINVSGGGKRSILTSIIGEDAMRTASESLGEGFEDWVDGQFETWMQSATQAVSTWYDTTMGYINDLISAYVELANAKAEAAKEATEAAQEEYDKEKALLEAGYASRVEATWAEYQEKKAAQEKAEADAKAAAAAQKELNEISTAGNMIVAASNIWKTFSELGPLGIAAAVAAIGTMFTAFVAAKVKASEVSKYGEGGFEVLEGGSHASGHDIDLGVKNRRGRRMRAEGKEGLGIFRIRAMNHYGADNIEGWVNSINRLEFEGNAAKRMSLERSVGMAVLSAPRTDLHRVENSLDKLVSYGSRSRYTEADGTVVEVRKSGVVRYRK